MLDGRDQQKIPGTPVGAEFDARGQGQHVGLGRTRGENHSARLGAHQCRDLCARAFNQGPGGPTLRMHGRRIAAELAGGNHRGTGLGAQRRRRIPVEIDPCHVDPCTLYLTRSLLFAFGIVLKAGRWAARAAALGASR